MRYPAQTEDKANFLRDNDVLLKSSVITPADINDNNSVSQIEATAAINRMPGLTDTQKAVFWG